MIKGAIKFPTYDYEGILLRNHEDLWQYMEVCSKEIELGIRSVFKSSEPAERWDHLLSTGDGGVFAGLFTMSIAESRMKGLNPLMNLDAVILRKYMAMTKSLNEGNIIVINKMGGWCINGDNEYVIHGEEPYSPMRNYYIGKKGQTRLINLENDPFVEEFTRVHLYKADNNYSIIKNMFHWKKADFIEVLSEFKRAGGEGIWVYTTGSDVDQMYIYTISALEVGLHEFNFIFNAGRTPEIEEFVTWCKNQPNVHILSVEYEDEDYTNK